MSTSRFVTVALAALVAGASTFGCAGDGPPLPSASVGSPQSVLGRQRPPNSSKASPDTASSTRHPDRVRPTETESPGDASVIPLPDSFGEADVTSSGASVDMTRAPGHDRLEMLAHVPDLVDEHVSPDPRGDDRDWNPSLFAGGHVLRYGSWWATGGGQTYLAIPFRGRAWGCGIAFFEPLGGNSVRFFGITQRMPTGETCVVGATAAGSLFVATRYFDTAIDRALIYSSPIAWNETTYPLFAP